MRTFLTILLLSSVAFGQKTAPPQGPPPKNLTLRGDGHFSANTDPANPEKFEVYTVKAGDTLSVIAGQVLKNPRLWPQLWEQNEHIVNPHWIYPNDKILIRPITLITEAAPPTPEPEVKAEPEAPKPVAPERITPMVAPARASAAPAPKVEPIFDIAPRKIAPEIKLSDMYCSGFVRKAPVPADLRISAKFNATGSALAIEGDYVYLSHGAEDGVKTGDTFQVIRSTRKIEILTKDKKSDRDLGMHYLDIGQVQVVMTQSDFSMARVVRVCEALEIGDFMLPAQRLEVPVLPRPRNFSPFMKATGDLHGEIVMTASVLQNFGSAFEASGILPGARHGNLKDIEKGIASTGGVVYVDLGQRTGVKAGDIFIVYRSPDTDSTLYGDVQVNAKSLAEHRTAVGELVILKVEETVSTALVTYTSTGLVTGDYIEKR